MLVTCPGTGWLLEAVVRIELLDEADKAEDVSDSESCRLLAAVDGDKSTCDGRTSPVPIAGQTVLDGLVDDEDEFQKPVTVNHAIFRGSLTLTILQLSRLQICTGALSNNR